MARRRAGQREARKDAAPRARKAASVSVTITDFDFSPKTVSIGVGETVTWTNQGPTVHTATGDGFDTGNLTKGQSGSHTFTQRGHVRLHLHAPPVHEGHGERGRGR